MARIFSLFKEHKALSFTIGGICISAGGLEYIDKLDQYHTGPNAKENWERWVYDNRYYWQYKEITHNVDKIPSQYLTENMLLTLLKADSSNINYIPEHLLTPELVTKYLEFVPTIYQITSKVPKKYQTQDMFKMALRKDIKNIRDVPPQFLTKEMCIVIINLNANVLALIPKEFQSLDMIKDVLARDPTCMRFIKLDYDKNVSNVIKRYIVKNKDNIQYVPSQYLTDDIWGISWKEHLVLKHAYSWTDYFGRSYFWVLNVLGCLMMVWKMRMFIRD